MTAYERILSELLNAGVRFLIVGGYAAIAHGLTRATDDLDIWIEPTRDNAERALLALSRCGISSPELTVDRLGDPYTFVRVGEDTGRKIDLMADPGGNLSFSRAWQDRLVTSFAELEIPFLGLQDLIRIKSTIGRHKDLADVESLRAFHRLKD